MNYIITLLKAYLTGNWTGVVTDLIKDLGKDLATKTLKQGFKSAFGSNLKTFTKLSAINTKTITNWANNNVGIDAIIDIFNTKGDPLKLENLYNKSKDTIRIIDDLKKESPLFRENQKIIEGLANKGWDESLIHLLDNINENNVNVEIEKIMEAIKTEYYANLEGQGSAMLNRRIKVGDSFVNIG